MQILFESYLGLYPSKAERAEKEKVKRMTLEINERQEEEEAAEIMQQVRYFLKLLALKSCVRQRLYFSMKISYEE